MYSNLNKKAIIASLRKMRDEAIEEKRNAIPQLVRAKKNEYVNAYRDRIIQLKKDIEPALNKIQALEIDLANDTNLNYMTYAYSPSLQSRLSKSVEEILEFIKGSSYFYKGPLSLYESQLKDELCALETEWTNLMALAKSLTVKELRQYLVDNNIQLPVAKAKPNTQLVVTNINLDMIFGENRKQL